MTLNNAPFFLLRDSIESHPKFKYSLCLIADSQLKIYFFFKGSESEMRLKQKTKYGENTK